MITFEQVTLAAPDGSIRLRDLNERFRAGTNVLILGGSADEGLVLKAIAGLTVPTHGSIRVDGLSVRDTPLLVRQRMTFVPPRAPVLPHLSPIELVRYLARLSGHGPTTSQITTALRRCEFPDRLLNRRSSSLDAFQRLAVWLALHRTRQSRVLLIDDPTHGLTRHQMRIVVSLMPEMRSPEQCVVITSPDLEFARQIADVTFSINRQSLSRGPEPLSAIENLADPLT